MLTRPEFLTYVEEHILEYVKDPEEKQASIRQVTKNNNISLNGLCIRKRRRSLPAYHLFRFLL